MSSPRRLDELPLFPPICATPVDDLSECSLFFIKVPCMRAFNEETLDFLGGELRGSHIWTFLVTLIVGISFLLIAKVPGQTLWRVGKSMTVTTGLYAVITAFFALFRFFLNISRPLHVVGVLHNTCEYIILAHLANFDGSSDRKQTLKNRIVGILSFNLFVQAFQMLIPSFKASFGWTSPLDTLMDITFVGAFVPMWLSSSKGKEVNDFYRLPAIAHTVHLIFTIGFVGFSIFFSGNSSWFSDFFLEVGINLSVPISHILYCNWAWNIYDEKAWKKVDKQDGSEEYVFVLEEKYQLYGVRKTIIISFFMGWFSYVLLPLAMGPCPQTPPQCFRQERRVTATTSFDVKSGFEIEFETFLQRKRIVESAREAPGNEAYRIIQNVYSPYQYQIVEVWESVGHLQEYRDASTAFALLDSSDIKQKMFVKGQMVDEGVFAESSPPECDSQGYGALTFEVDNSCDGVWNAIQRSHSCFWVPGCTYTSGTRDVFLSNDGSYLNMEMDDMRNLQGRWYTSRGNTLVSEVSEAEDRLTGYIGTIAAHDSSGGRGSTCTVRYQFSIPLDNPISATSIQDAFRDHIPVYKKLLSKNSSPRWSTDTPMLHATRAS